MNLSKRISFVDLLLLCTILITGGFNEFVSCLFSVAASIYLLFKILKNKSIIIKMNLISIAVVVICLMYGLTAFWAIDSGMAIIGFFKFLPLLLFLVVLWQSETPKYGDILPYFGAVTVLISVIGMNIKLTSGLFSVAGRLSGFFQYPNTFALFLLVCELILIGKDKLRVIDYVCLAVLAGGVLYTGSRTVFIIAVLSNIAMLIYNLRNGLKKKSILVIVGVAIVGGIAVLFLNWELLNRYLSISFHESTFVGRVLYWMDSLPLLIKYPFGMGYLGYNYIQHSIQTGVYNVRYIHNDFLQLFLDIGWIPAILFVLSIFRVLLKRDVPLKKKIVISTICVHSFFDFNLQFLSIFLLLICCLESQNDKKITLNKSTKVFKTVLVLFIVMNLYMAIHLLLVHFNQNEVAERIYPWNTENKIAMIEKESDIEKANVLAEGILTQNSHSYIPYSIKSKYFYSKGDFTQLIKNKHILFEKNPFEYKEYEEYALMLVKGISVYQKVGDYKSVQFCEKELIATKEKLESNRSRLSQLGKKIKDQPKTKLPEELLNYIKKLEEG